MRVRKRPALILDPLSRVAVVTKPEVCFFINLNIMYPATATSTNSTIRCAKPAGGSDGFKRSVSGIPPMFVSRETLGLFTKECYADAQLDILSRSSSNPPHPQRAADSFLPDWRTRPEAWSCRPRSDDAAHKGLVATRCPSGGVILLTRRGLHATNRPHSGADMTTSVAPLPRNPTHGSPNIRHGM